MTIIAAPTDLEKEADELTSAIAACIGVEHGHTNNFASLKSRVVGLGLHAVHQAALIVRAHPDLDLRPATSDLLTKDDTDGFAFLGIESWTHRRLKETLRLVGGQKRYFYRDLLQAPAHILAEARALLGITNLLLSGDIYDGSENVRETRDGWLLNNEAIISLVQRHPTHGMEILRIMKEELTFNTVRIETQLASTRPLLDGVL